MKTTHSRIERLADLIKKEVSEILLFEVKDPRVHLVTIIHAELTGDMKHAKIFFSTLNVEQDLADTLKGLERAAGFIQKRLGARMHIRYVPHLEFCYDNSMERASHLLQIIRDLPETDTADDAS
jgi:ribosome-binding factor A